MTGTVYKSTGSWYTVKSEKGDFVECRMKGKFRIKGIKSTNPIAVGDIVDYELDETSDAVTGTIHTIHERKNYIVRKSVNLSKQIHIIASNIDQVFLLVTIDNPPTTTSFIDRFLVTAEAYGIEAILIFNKIDTLNEQTLDDQLYLQHIYTEIGYKCLRISSTENKGVDKLKEMMVGKVSMFSGHSGVGKSTLVNAMEPSLHLKTSVISEQSKQGQHTTTFAEMYDLSFDARIIDTPGIKGFGIVDMEPTEISGYFPEFFKLKDQCKFNNCLHKEEPHCAIKAALEKDEIAWSRYNSYLKILEGDEEHYRTDIYGEDRAASDETRK
ncbi:ribosome small subunit-dependent GTPase A [Flavobacterium johnsoniae]|uniref:Small ribosomal subunit biogenesis GTPase RsgA n=1 Tax=Flavobacterium johnsoniae (strain ATCC 17061 / DSM 2064 / JCM 8514 / BCRC 14874 / CCUG 350202 / NBRC 14942 / NCIMB 11054 / UW101) TaxID=376686 RepID=RSGA_FLAJ1|nr:ribosome small subunit-dependent GTPase A [Flavobacterium johnsoniae]A5FML2.1 RecName: Full=Small ribosomal subunit biogenesis GTPase RsgA [Flavobacterium johnsoniae UW101]ABQ03548.1 ribosome small subunit-dependent GTPase A [Flavobacterium johnsoniae UW101]OXE95972.1 ribosome small subunit-dependent GTPase A [Flavobacterium johnsoniae UW101]WQG79587.1 ribosome small subunit-dependent GTPase A [Flavobacterium johnsoniae UW101]SHL95408.1 ribosome biogenesis GTPase [Flavobacterium johnsoniae]